MTQRCSRVCTLPDGHISLHFAYSEVNSLDFFHLAASGLESKSCRTRLHLPQNPSSLACQRSEKIHSRTGLAVSVVPPLKSWTVRLTWNPAQWKSKKKIDDFTDFPANCKNHSTKGARFCISELNQYSFGLSHCPSSPVRKVGAPCRISIAFVCLAGASHEARAQETHPRKGMNFQRQAGRKVGMAQIMVGKTSRKTFTSA